MDLISEGNVGLIKAIEKINVDKLIQKNVCFMTYSTFWIRQSILMYLYNYNGMFKLNPQLTNELRKMKKSAIELEQKLCRKPTIDEIVDYININKESLRCKRLIKLFYINKTTDEGLVNVPDVQQNSHMFDELKFKVDNILLCLTYREAQVLKMSFGIDEDEMSSIEISKKLNLSVDRVRAIKKSGINRFATIVKEKRLYL